ncbi:MAG: hypothetical protein CL940_09860 [Deltaproteobacteria bacterium]|nr:hypothetical protein [Deltaproteobacteria bacterium]
MAGDAEDDDFFDGATQTFPADQTTIPNSQGKVAEFVDGVEGEGSEAEEGTLRYKRQELLGKGGNGVVVSVYDKKMHRSVALKLSKLSDSGMQAHIEFLRGDQLRFLREARVTGQLTHPNIMPVYDIGTDVDDNVFFTMKRVEGRSLRQLLRSGEAGSLVERLLVFRQVCNAMAFAHSQGVLHRDLKPANVMVGEFGEVLVVDWGLCKVIDAPEESFDHWDAPPNTGDSQLTQVGQVAGTPAFMAPEQAAGEIDQLDFRTDIYSLGALLYSLLTDKSPFAGKPDAIIEAVRQGQLVPPSDRVPDVPKEMNAIVMKAMALKKEDRYPTVSELSADVQAFIEGRTVSALTYSPLQRLSKWAERNRSVVRPVGFISIFALVLVISGGLIHLGSVGEARDAAVQEARRALDAERLARVEALQGRAAVGTAEALYGRPGTALEQLREVQARMIALETDTARADIGLALLKRTSSLPHIHMSFEGGPRLGVFTADDSSFFVQVAQELVHVEFYTGRELGRWPLLMKSAVLGPIEGGAPWALRGTERGVEGVHPISGKRRQWLAPQGACPVSRPAVNDRWISLGCGGHGLVVWPWGEPTNGTLYPTSDEKMKAKEMSEDGRRVLVERPMMFRSVLDTNHAVLDEGRVVWEDRTRALDFALSPDGQWIFKKTANGFEVTHIDTMTVHAMETKLVGRVFWSADSKQVVVVFQEGSLTYYDVSRAEVRVSRDIRISVKRSLHATFPGSKLHRWVHIDGKKLNLFETRPPGRPLQDLNLQDSSVAAGKAAQSASGDLVAIGTDGGRIFVLDRATGVTLWDLSASDRPVRGLSFLPSERQLVSGHWDGKARVWNLETGAVDRVFEPTKPTPGQDDAKVTMVNVLDSERVLLSGGDGHLGIWSLTTGELVDDLTGTIQYAWDSDWNGKTNRLVVSDRMGSESGLLAAVFDLTSGTLLKEVPNPPQKKLVAFGIAMAPDGQRFMVTTSGRASMVYDKDGELLAQLETQTPPSMELGWSADGALVAVSDYSGQYQVWTTHNWEAVASVDLADLVVDCLFSPDRREILGVNWSGQLYDLDLTGAPARWGTQRRSTDLEVDERELSLQAWRRAATNYDWPAALKFLERAIQEGHEASGLTLARYRMAGGDRAGALAALSKGPDSDTMTAIWRSALTAQAP